MTKRASGKGSAVGTSVDSIRHKDKRVNIPTEELRDFVADDENTPKTMLYPRDPSLDPQLVWQGKDEQDRANLAVPVVPIYIQEKIHPQAIIDALPRLEKPGGKQLGLFADFNGGPAEFDQKVEFYRHEQNWSNRMILGDSLLVMTSLAEKEGLKGKVQTIYLDPPYGIKFGSNWQVSTRKRTVEDGKAEDVTRQPEQVRAFRDTWKLGIHSYLTYLRDRLVVARELLTETGSVFVQISDENLHLVRCSLDEVFGSENFWSVISFRKTGQQTTNLMQSSCDYVIAYAKDKKQVKYRRLYIMKRPGDEGAKQYILLELSDGTIRRMTKEELANGILPRDVRVFRQGPLTSPGANKNDRPIIVNGRFFPPTKGRHWSIGADDTEKLFACGRAIVVGNTPCSKLYLDELGISPLTNTWSDTGGSGFADEQAYGVKTDNVTIQRCLLMTTDPGDLALDPTCGSGTTAYVAEQWGRRWITCDTSRVALALARTRLMAAKFPYYLLADSAEGIKKEAEITGKFPPSYETGNDIRKGFVYKRVPHVTLKSIANNSDIKEGMTRQEIDAAIARHAETEILFDQPYEDKKTVRVSGLFTVESLSPHRMLRTVDGEEWLVTSKSKNTSHKSQTTIHSSFELMILDNLKKAGVQNTKKGERLKFDTLEPFAGEWLHAAGVYTEADGKVRRVAISIGPEQGTVGPQQVKEAAKEAVQGVGFDLLIVCGFAFDPHVSEEARRYGMLTVLPARMNPDLAMGDELLKKTGAGNLFMVFGEPDVEVVSGLWLVTRDGRMVAHYDSVKELSGLGSLEEINRVGGENLSRLKKLSTGREVRADEPDAEGGGIGTGEHRGGSGEDGNRGISPVPERVERLTGGSGNVADSGRSFATAASSGDAKTFGRSGADQQNARRTKALAAIQALKPSDFPFSLTTSHYSQITLLGVDVYDPTTGQIRSSSTDDIACWFIDTEYNGESFFVRHAYFSGAGEPYDKLKRALRTEIDEAAWSSLYSTISRPFDPPETGKIAVKVINHYGDEVLKVYQV